MQPPRPFPGAPYDKDMFTFLPAPFSRDVLAEASRKRKLVASDQQITGPAPNIRHGFSEKLDTKPNMGDLQGKELQNSFPVSPSGGLPNLQEYSHQGRYRDENNMASWHPIKRDLHETRSEHTGSSSFSGQLQSSNHKDSSPLFPMSEGQTHRTSGPPLIGENFNQLEDHQFNALGAREENASHFQEFRNGRPQTPVQMKVAASGSYETASKNLGESRSLQQNILKPGNFVAGSVEQDFQSHKTSTWPSLMTRDFNHIENHPSSALVAREHNASHFQEFRNCMLQKPDQMKILAADSHEQASKNLGDSESLQQKFLGPVSVVGFEEKSSHEETHKRDSSPNAKRIGDAKMFGDNGDNSVHNLQRETNNLLQNALRLLSASSSVGVADNNDGKIQGYGDDVKTTKLTLDSCVQNLKHSLTETTLSRSVESVPNLDNPGLNGKKGSHRKDEGCKPENGASTLAEKLWDGTLQLSSSVSVSAIAFFKSGEKMQDFSWSESVEVKGKVRLEAFEKYVQDLPRSRTRGLMVMSLCWKEGSSDASYKGMKEIARKYKDQKRVGFAQLSTGVDMYICPHSDTIITILAKHGFFKGMTAVKDKSDPLIGCVVWRKNTSSVPATKSTEVNGPKLELPLNSPSNSSAPLVVRENLTKANKNQELITSSSEKGQTLAEGEDKSRRENNPEYCISPRVHQPNHATIPQNKHDMELNKPGVQKQCEASSDDDDLPEYDFRAAVSQTSARRSSEVRTVDSGRLELEQFRDSHVPRPMSAQIQSESSTISRTPPDFHFQGTVPQNIGHQSESCIPNFPTRPQSQTAECTASSKPPDFHFQGPVPPDFQCQGPVPKNRGHQPELQIPSLPVQPHKQIGNCNAGSKPRNLFDDDDMPEWCPPDFTKPRHEIAQRAGPSFASSRSEVPLIPVPPSTQLQVREKDSAHHPPRSPADQLASNGFTHKDPAAPPGFAPNPAAPPGFAPNPAAPPGFAPNPAAPPGFAPNPAGPPAFRPRFDAPHMMDPVHPSPWRGPRP